jgi:hypothetical protein
MAASSIALREVGSSPARPFPADAYLAQDAIPWDRLCYKVAPGAEVNPQGGCGKDTCAYCALMRDLPAVRGAARDRDSLAAQTLIGLTKHGVALADHRTPGAFRRTMEKLTWVFQEGKEFRKAMSHLGATEVPAQEWAAVLGGRGPLTGVLLEGQWRRPGPEPASFWIRAWRDMGNSHYSQWLRALLGDKVPQEGRRSWGTTWRPSWPYDGWSRWRRRREAQERRSWLGPPSWPHASKGSSTTGSAWTR